MNLTIPTNQVELYKVKQTLRDMVLSGDNEPLEVFARLKGAEEAIAETLKDKEVKEAVLSQAHNYPDKTFEVHGASWTKKQAGVKHHYEFCGDPVYDKLNAQLAKLTAQIKSREKYLQSIPKEGEEFIDPDTGEMTVVYPPSKTGTEIVQCKLL